MKCHIDFETRSVVDLKKAGIDIYAKHPTTDALCMAWCIDKGPVNLWVLGDSFPKELKKAIDNGAIITAHNAVFEAFIWNYVCIPKYNWPPIPLSSFDCTMIKGYALGLPGHLANAALAAGLKMKKDLAGQRIMLQLCKPRNGPLANCNACKGTGVAIRFAPTMIKETCSCVKWWPKRSKKYATLHQYCKQDIFVEREYDERILPLSKTEKSLWLLDQKINNIGVYVDRPAIQTALKIVEGEKIRLDDLMRKATKNQVATCNAAKSLKDWINTFNIYRGAKYSSDGPPSQLKGQEGKPKWLKGQKKICQGVGKDIMLSMLELPKLPLAVKKAIEIRQEAAKSSTAKLKAMIDGASPDGRVRHCFQFNGAASTGRWAGRRIQLHNMPRPTIKQDQIEDIVKALMLASNSSTGRHNEMFVDNVREYIDLFHGAPMIRIADCLRAMIKAPPGKKLIACDFSSIEGRGLAWLAGEEKKLSIFRGHGKVYEATACQIYGLTNIDDVNKDQRLIGKVAELAFGYQGGVGACQSMAKVYFLKITDSKADEIKKAWRIANPNIVQYWYEVERAAINAAKYSGEKFAVGPNGRKVVFLKRGSFLFCRLPSGRAICYPYPKMQMVKTPWGEMKNALTYKGEENYQFVTKVAYGGLIAENITQAMCRDLLAEALVRVDAKGYPIIMHVHDEIVCETDKNFGTLEEVERIMCEVPHWAKDMPIKAAGWVGERYRK